jgi:hypothetical protein
MTSRTRCSSSSLARGLAPGGLAIAVLIAAGACASPLASPEPVLAGEIAEAPSASETSPFGDPIRAINGVRGGGPSQGSLDVFSLDLDSGSHMVLGFEGRTVTDGPGIDFVVFENAFRSASGSSQFMDPIIVSVSRDGAHWVALPHDYVAPDETAYSRDPDHWIGFAGVSAVLLHAESNPVDPFDPIAAGGDAFDLADLADLAASGDPEAEAILEDGFLWIRLDAAGARTNPDTGAPYPREPVSNGPDIDGVYARWITSRSE